MSSFVQPGSEGSIRAALRSEWTKFRTVRGWMIAVVFAALMVVAFTYLQANGKHTGYCTTPNPSSCVNRPSVRSDRTVGRSCRRHLSVRCQAPDR